MRASGYDMMLNDPRIHTIQCNSRKLLSFWSPFHSHHVLGTIRKERNIWSGQIVGTWSSESEVMLCVLLLEINRLPFAAGKFHGKLTRLPSPWSHGMTFRAPQQQTRHPSRTSLCLVLKPRIISFYHQRSDLLAVTQIAYGIVSPNPLSETDGGGRNRKRMPIRYRP